MSLITVLRNFVFWPNISLPVSSFRLSRCLNNLFYVILNAHVSASPLRIIHLPSWSWEHWATMLPSTHHALLHWLCSRTELRRERWTLLAGNLQDSKSSSCWVLPILLVCGRLLWAISPYLVFIGFLMSLENRLICWELLWHKQATSNW